MHLSPVINIYLWQQMHLSPATRAFIYLQWQTHSSPAINVFVLYMYMYLVTDRFDWLKIQIPVHSVPILLQLQYWPVARYMYTHVRTCVTHKANTYDTQCYTGSTHKWHMKETRVKCVLHSCKTWNTCEGWSVWEASACVYTHVKWVNACEKVRNAQSTCTSWHAEYMRMTREAHAC